MAETIEYDSLRKFIEHDIIEEKIPYAIRIGATGKKQKLNYMKNQGGGAGATMVAPGQRVVPGQSPVIYSPGYGYGQTLNIGQAPNIAAGRNIIDPYDPYKKPGMLQTLGNFLSFSSDSRLQKVGAVLVYGSIIYGVIYANWPKGVTPVGIDPNDPAFPSEVATVQNNQGTFRLENKETTFKNWIEKSAPSYLEKKDFALFYLEPNNKIRLTQLAIYSYIMQDFNSNNQRADESNISYYNRVKSAINNEIVNKKVVSENLFVTLNVTSGDLFDACAASDFNTKFSSKNNAFADAIIDFIKSNKMLCYNVVGSSISEVDRDFIKSKMGSAPTPTSLRNETAQLFISDFIRSIYNESMKALLPEALERKVLINHFKSEIAAEKTVDTYEVDPLNPADLVKSVSNSEFKEALLEVVYFIWLQRQLMILNNETKLEYGELQKQLYTVILKKHKETQGVFFSNNQLLDSIKDDFELVKCVIKELNSKMSEAITKTELQNTKGKFTSPELKELSKIADYQIGDNMGIVINEVSGLLSASSGKLCSFEKSAIERLKQNDAQNMIFSTSWIKDADVKTNTNSINYSLSELAKVKQQNIVEFENQQKEEQRTSGTHIATCIIISSIVVCGFFYYMYSDDESKLTVTNSLIASLVAILGAYGLFETGLLMSALKSFFGLFGISTDLFGGGAAVSTNSLSGLWNQLTSSVGSAVSSAANSGLITMIQQKFPSVNNNTILGIVGAVSFATAIGGFMALRSLMTSAVSSNPAQNLAQLQALVKSGKKFSLEAAQFSFNPSTGAITTVYRPSSKNYILISLGSHFGINEIYMVIEPNGSISYEVGDLKVDSKSYIENKPVETALVLAYLVKDKHFSKLSSHSSSSSGESSDYVFNFEDDGSLVLSKKDSQGKLVQIESVSSVIKQQMANDSNAAANKTKVCKDLFGSENESCNKHFYSILGRAGLNMLANIGEAASKSAIISKLNSAEVNIKYEILKNLDWKMKISNGNKAMVSVAEWVQRLKDDKRENVKDLGNKYEGYLNSKQDVKQLLENMVNHINTNSRLLAEKYKEAVEQPAASVKRRRRLTSEQVGKLRSQVITENNLLYTPFPFPGRPGVLAYPLNQNGGGHNNFDYKQSFNMIKQSLAGFKQKLSTATEKKLEEKIQKIEKLENDLADIHSKIYTYTKILRSDRNSRFHKKEVRIEDIEDLINQYATGSKKQTTYIATVTTAFGKIKMLLESQDGNTVQRENYYNL